MSQRASTLRPRIAVGVGEAVELAARHLEARPLLVVSDFDGTLSRIVDDPWGAAILPLGRRALRALAGLPQVYVVVLSGRTAADAASRVRVGGVAYLGNHGMERAFLRRGGRPERLRTMFDETAHEAAHAAARLADEVPHLVPEPRLVFERNPPPEAFQIRTAPDSAPLPRVRRCRRWSSALRRVPCSCWVTTSATRWPFGCCATCAFAA